MSKQGKVDQLQRLPSDVQEYLRMLSYRRPGGSVTETLFNKQFLDCLPGMTIDKVGNRICRVGGEVGQEDFYPVLWSSHTDTVHSTPGFQKIAYAEQTGFAYLHESGPKKESNCLGADCTTGVFIMREMLLAGIPGLYIFHAKEETGGIGSSYIARYTPELLSGINIAVAFDRRDTNSVITHQGGRCASNKFAAAFAQMLGGQYKIDDGGIFTDTANYVDLVPECTNISVGYDNAHTSSEYQDVNFMLWLRDRMLVIGPQVSSLPVARDPQSDYEWPSWKSAKYDKDKGYTTNTHWWDHYDNNYDDKPHSLLWLVQEYPDTAVDILEELGVTPEYFKTRNYQ